MATSPRHRRQVSDVVLNRNVNWLNHPAAWAWYFGLIFLCWVLCSVVINDYGMAWTYVHLIHGVFSYYLLHWMKVGARLSTFGLLLACTAADCFADRWGGIVLQILSSLSMLQTT